MNVRPVRADLGEVDVLGEEPVAGMDGIGAGNVGGADDPLGCSGSSHCNWRVRSDGFIRQPDGREWASACE